LKVALFSRYPKDAGAPRGGVESVTVVLVRALARLGSLDVHVVTLERDRNGTAVEQSDGATIHRLPGSRWPQILDIHWGPGRKRLVEYLRRLKPDVVHSHETYGLALWDIDIPHVFTVHGFDHANLPVDGAKCGRLRGRIWARAERRGLARHKHIISISPYVRAMIEPLTRAVIHDIENPVDERFFGVRPMPEPGRILCVGWINERKNTLGSVQALAEVARRGMKAKLVIAGHAGEHDYLNRVKACIVENSLEGRVEFLGHIGHERLLDELSRASILLLPSRQENSPMAIAEAMAAGVPVVVADRCGMPYMVREGETGFLVDPEDPGAIGERLGRMLADEGLRATLGRAGRAEASSGC
jgi:glycosyltransferase involved in cell wall biosynthesis